jgi:hypothetical protein
VTVVTSGLAWQSVRGLGCHMGVGAIKKLVEDIHLRARGVAFLSSSCLC